ncbi:polyphosphate kinase 1 [Mucilaginibacter terrae]|uniref:Polyphosphate kinase n=1 Tax=Mucilaginibacter terrae TaxID=1955052 RepID=A0ABU3GY38_9SPHI|nr:polyphosphate kinase 1 [Mucilaginibacter terrae]MDT3404684.1 polyphosphate kinase [Mucilaginibacter terrae]
MYQFFNRDLSWLSFNERVLQEADRESLPLLERINFLSIFSSNLDEFYRVRMPVLAALHKLNKSKKGVDEVEVENGDVLSARQMIQKQQEQYGQILTQDILPQLSAKGVAVVYNQHFPEEVVQQAADYFLSQVMAFLQPVVLTEASTFFPENNQLYFLVQFQEEKEKLAVLNIPSDELPRFFKVTSGEQQYIVFLDDIIRYNLDKVFTQPVLGCYSFKVTRDAEYDLEDEYTGDLAEQLEKQLKKRDYGLATRFLHEPGLPLRSLHEVSRLLGLKESSLVSGGRYHNLKDLSALPVDDATLKVKRWPVLRFNELPETVSVLDAIGTKDHLLHTPYQSYDTILRFFNEAAIRPDVEEIYVSLYRVASDSKIVHALISAAKNGKKVNVLVELKARFDEANNIKWAKKLKAAGAKIIYSVTALKVHAKIALVKLRSGNRLQYRGLLATGNFNENTARFYTDHIMLTGNHNLLREMELVFIFLSKKQKPTDTDAMPFQNILVAQFNLQNRFLDMIDTEINNHKQGLPASITIKMNNLEEEVLISKLYEASNAGVKIQLIVRSICRLVPGIPSQSENITVTRIVDRYLEHGRIFIFGNNGDTRVYMGSADWMNRNIYHRIEVCFPILDEAIKQEVLQIINFQLKDNTQAVHIDTQLNNIPVMQSEPVVRSQQQIYELLQQKS